MPPTFKGNYFMIKEILFSAAVLGLGTPRLLAAERPQIEVLNSTDYDISLVPANISEEYYVSPHSFGSVPLDEYPEDGLKYSLYITSSETLPTIYLYAFDGLPSPIDVVLDFNLVAFNIYQAAYDFGSVYYPQKMQFYTRKSLVGETYYLKTPSLENTNNAQIDILSVLNATATINDRSLTSLVWQKQKMESGLIGYGSYVGNGVLIASNSKVADPVDFNQMTNVLLYREGWSNVLTFTSGSFPRAYTLLGYDDDFLDVYLSEKFIGYVTLASSDDIGTSLVPLTTGFNIVGLVIDAMNSFFTWQVLPGLTIGVLVLIPIIVMIVLALLKLVKKG